MNIFSASLVILSIITTQKLFAQENLDRTIISYSVNFYALTTFAVRCDRFQQAFNGRIDTIYVRAADSIHRLDLMLEKVKFKHSKRALDTRASIIFTTSSGMKLTICMDLWNIAVNGKIISSFPELDKFLRSLVPKKNHPNGFHS
jgi:hypothetical protein